MTQLTLPTFGNSGSPVDSNANQCLSSFSDCEFLTIALIDSCSLNRDGITRLLNKFESLRLIPISCCSELLQKGPEVLSEIQIVLLNIFSATIDNPEIVRNIALLNESLPNTLIIVICYHEDSHQIDEALRQVHGSIAITLTWQILRGALRLVQAGGTFILPCALTPLLSQQPIASEAAKVEVMAPDFCALTKRQREVLNLLRQGRQNKMIAHELNVRESTVKVHVRQILRKMRVKNRTEAALLARQMRNENDLRTAKAGNNSRTCKDSGENGY